MTFGFICSCVPASALELNSFRRANYFPRCTGALRSTARRHQAANRARRNSLDHDGFYQRMDGDTRAAENVAMIACERPSAKPVVTFADRACGCADADCAFQLRLATG
jgi:hypothetical protein